MDVMAFGMAAGTQVTAVRRTGKRDLVHLALWILGVQMLFWLLVLVVRPPVADPNLTQTRLSGISVDEGGASAESRTAEPGYLLGEGAVATFRASVVLADPARGLVVFAPRFNRSARLWVNGTEIASADAQAWRGGRLGGKWSVPASSLHEGVNVLALRVERECCRAYLAGLHAAPPGEIDRAIRDWRLKRIVPTFAMAVLGAFGAIACIYLALNGAMRGLAAAAGLALGGIALGACWQIDIFTPSSEALYNWAGQAILVLTLSGLVALADRWFPPEPRFDRHLRIAVPVFFSLVTLGALVPDGLPALWRTGIEAAMALAANTAIVAAALRGLAADRRAWASDVGFFLLVPTISVVDVFDALHKDPLTLTSAPLGLLALVVMLLLGIVRRGRSLFAAAARANANLAERIAAKESELEETAGLLRRREAEAAVQAERGRIMRDMHDGMGGQLLSVLMLARDEHSERRTIAETTENAIDDLRLLIDSLDSVGDSLGIALGQFRDRVETKLRAAGIMLAWENRLGHDTAIYPPSVVLAVYRVLQEAVNNVVRHSGADSVRIAIREELAHGVVIEVADNGKGFAGATAQGRGIANMKERARAIDATLDLTADESGTRLCLVLPSGLGQHPASCADWPH